MLFMIDATPQTYDKKKLLKIWIKYLLYVVLPIFEVDS